MRAIVREKGVASKRTRRPFFENTLESIFHLHRDTNGIRRFCRFIYARLYSRASEAAQRLEAEDSPRKAVTGSELLIRGIEA
jgi:hypothetical protein